LWARRKKAWDGNVRCPRKSWRERAHGRKNCGGAAAEREIAGVSEAIGEEQTRDAEAAVALFHLQNAFGVQLATNDHVVMKMDAAFRGTGAARRVQPERGFVFAGVRGLQIWRARGHQIFERVMSV